MKEIEVIRIAYLQDVTLGLLCVDGLVFPTLEEHWLPDPDGPGGQRRQAALVESCIPDGEYEFVPHISEKYPLGVWCFVNHQLGVYHQKADMPAGQSEFGRVACLLHSGNTTLDIEGCMLIGRRHSRLDTRSGDLPAVLDSKLALGELRRILGTTERHHVRIRAIRGTDETLPAINTGKA